MATITKKVRLKRFCLVFLPFTFIGFFILEFYLSNIEQVYRHHRYSPLHITPENLSVSRLSEKFNTIPGNNNHNLVRNETGGHLNKNSTHGVETTKTGKAQKEKEKAQKEKKKKDQPTKRPKNGSQSLTVSQKLHSRMPNGSKGRFTTPKTVNLTTTVTKKKVTKVKPKEPCNCPVDVHYDSACSFTVLDNATRTANKVQRQKSALRQECSSLPECQEIPTLFQQTLSVDEINAFLDLFKKFDETMDKINASYFVAGGTVIGSMRHHGFIPWDDDIDVYVPLSQKANVTKALNALKPDYKEAYRRPLLSKFFSKNATRVKKLNYGWPSIDIFFYSSNATHIECQLFPKYSTKPRHFKIKNIFPLRKRPFCNISVNIAKDPLAYLKEMYRGFTMETCIARDVNHRRQEPLSYTMKGKKVIPCKNVSHVYPHVKSKTLNSTHVEETTYMGDKVLNKFILEK